MSTEAFDISRTRTFLPRVLPIGWDEFKSPSGFGYIKYGDLKVIISGTEYDGEWWLHLSASRTRSIPSHEDLKEVKDLFIGRENLAVQVFPPKSEFINLHPYVLHLWHRPDKRPTPDFRIDGMI